jgi:hypothetical protein
VALPGRAGDIEYLRLLHLAASTMESQVETVIEELLAEGRLPESETVKARVKPDRAEVPVVTVPEVDLGEYDAFLSTGGKA